MSDELDSKNKKRDRQTKITVDMETDTLKRKHTETSTAIIFMIKGSVQLNSNLDCPVRGNQVGGRALTDV